VNVEETGESGYAAVRIHGTWEGPPAITRSPGWVNYRLRLLKGVPYLFIDGEVRYPETYRRQVIQAAMPVLARKIDAGWEEVAPVELRFAAPATKDQPFWIHKRNYLGKEDAYALDYFRYAPQNVNIPDINNHITSEYAAVTTAERGMAVAMNTEVNANFAFCPFKMTYQPESDEFMIQANPFGTYHGNQVLPPNPGNRLGYEAVLLSGPQFHSAGPTYNGYHDRFELMISFFSDDTLPNDVKQDLIAFARRPMTVGAYEKRKAGAPRFSPLPPDGFMALPYHGGMVFHWEDMGSAGTGYRIHLSGLSGADKRTFSTSGSTLFLESTDLPKNNGSIHAAIEAIYPDGRASERSPEHRYRLAQDIAPSFDIPNEFKAKILWATMTAWIYRNLMI
jgi:hypothetical protein